MAFVASLIRSFGSTPGITLRMRDMTPSLPSYRPMIMARSDFGTTNAMIT